jgi:tetratricopeptide (TPR) repeat protein
MKVPCGRVLVPVLLLSLACDKNPSSSGPAKPGPSAEITDGRNLLGAGRADEVLTRFQGNGTPEGLLLLADAWAKKAETAPLPTPETAPPDSPRGFVPATPEFKPEELRAIEHYEKAAAALPEDPRPSLGLATVLAPHAVRRYEAAQAVPTAAPKPIKGRPTEAPTTPPPPPPGPDFSAARVSAAYRKAAEKSTDAQGLEALYSFAVRTGQLDDADWALQQRMRRDNENTDHILRYGDFLRDVKKDSMSAISAYRQILIWHPEDAAAKSRIADIYLDLGGVHYQKGEYASAEARYEDARKWIPDRTSEQYQRLEREVAKLRRLRR